MLRTLRCAGLVLLVGCANDFDALLDDGAARSDGSSGGAAAGGGIGGGGATASASTSASGASAGPASGSGGGPVGAGGSAGAGGHPPEPVCGNGIIEGTEECDDAGTQPALCAACVVVCAGPFETKDPTTHRCYYMTLTDGMHTGWDGGRTWCQSWGGDLAIFETADELAFVTPLLPQDYNEDEWIGGGDQQTEGTFTWVNGAPLVFTQGQDPWLAGEPGGGSGENCAAITPGGKLLVKSCSAGLTHHMCERAPVGAQ